MKVINMRLVLLAAILAIVFSKADRADAPAFRSKPCGPRSNTAKRAMAYRRKVIMASIPSRDSRGNKLNTSKISYEPLSNAGEKIVTCIVWRMS